MEAHVEELFGRCDWFDRELRSIDDRLQLVWVGSRVPPEEAPLGAVPGRFHIRYDAPEHPVYLPIVGDNDTFCEPGSVHLERLKQTDLQGHGRQYWRDVRAKQQKEREKRHEALLEEKREELYQRLMAGTQIQVSRAI